MPTSPDRPLFTRRNLLKTVAFTTAGMAVGALGVGACSRSTIAPDVPQAMAGEGPEPTKIPDIPTIAAVVLTEAPKPSPAAAKPIETLKPVDTSTPAATATTASVPSPTEAPQPTATVLAATPTKEASPTPKPENPLPRYGVFSGNVTDPKTGAKLAEMLMASIPQEGSLDEIFSYWITTRDERGGRTHSGNQYKFSSIKGNHFEIGGSSFPKFVAAPRLTADYNSEQKTIAGVTYWDSKPEQKVIEGVTYTTYPDGKRFTLQLVGEGKETILKTMKKIISDLSSDQPTTPERELTDLHLDTKAKLWP